jgi:hypothetical protein
MLDYCASKLNGGEGGQCWYEVVRKSNRGNNSVHLSLESRFYFAEINTTFLSPRLWCPCVSYLEFAFEFKKFAARLWCSCVSCIKLALDLNSVLQIHNW